MQTTSHSTWYKDAIIYEVHVRSFFDASGNGIGNFAGLTKKLEYIADLGVTAIWLLPFYPSPGRDDGYDTADYCSINPEYGTLRDFRRFLKQAHALGLKVITELVLNHTSDQHAWFQRARRAPKGSPHREYYVWSDTPDKYAQARIIFQDYEISNWTWDPVAHAYYWHRFFSHQPDLNYENPAVQREMFKVVDFWLGMGVDGLRLDAVPYLYQAEGTNCENLEPTFDFLKTLRSHVDKRHANRMLLAEANQWPEEAVRYFGSPITGDACHMAFHFPLMPRLYMALRMEDRFPIIDIMEQTPAIPENCQWTIFLRNHDELTLEMVTDEEREIMYRGFAPDLRARINLGIRRRLAPLLGNERRVIELMHILLLTMPGTPVIYYGDEICMGDNIYLGDRNGVRTPMQWSADRNAGFSTANPQQLYLPVIIDPEYHYETVNVENQERNPASFLWWLRRCIAIRKRHLSFGRGEFRFVSHSNAHVLAYIRQTTDEQMLVVANLSRFAQAVRLDLRGYQGCVPMEIFSGEPFPRVSEEHYPLTLGPHGYLILTMQKAVPADAAAPRIVPSIRRRLGRGEFLDSEMKLILEETVLPDYLRHRGILVGRRDELLRFELLEALPAGKHDRPAWVFTCGIDEAGAGPRRFLGLLVCAHFGQDAQRLATDQPDTVICSFQETGEPDSLGILREGWPAGADATTLLRHFSQSRSLQGARGTIELVRLRRGWRHALGGISPDAMPGAEYMAPTPHSAQLLVGELTLTLFTQSEQGPRHGVEMLKILQSRPDVLVPELLGELRYRSPDGEPASLAVLQRKPAAETTLAGLCRNHVRQCLESLLSDREQRGKAPMEISLAPVFRGEELDATQKWVGSYLSELFARLGDYLARFHLALASPGLKAAFRPEPFSRLYQRSVFQSVQTGVKKACAALGRITTVSSPRMGAAVTAILARREPTLAALRRLPGMDLRCLKLRIHGRCTLDILHYTGKEPFFADLEGNESQSLTERAIKRSPLRDLADLERSLWLLTHEFLAAQQTFREEEVAVLAPWAGGWSNQLFASCLQRYLAKTRTANPALLPEKPEEAAYLFRVFQLDRRFRALIRALERDDAAALLLAESSIATLDEFIESV